MERRIIKSENDYLENTDNIIVGEFPHMVNSQIIFNGNNNIMYCDKNVHLKNCKIIFDGNNNIVYLSENSHEYHLNVAIYNNSVLYFGKNNYMNGILNIILSEGENVIIGNDCLFSFGIWIRVADPHLIYSIATKKRINMSKSVFIGDHVWIGQSALLLKGTTIGSGSIIGAMSVTSNIIIPSNESWGGVPAKLIKSQIFWKSDCVHRYTKRETEKSMIFSEESYIYGSQIKQTVNVLQLNQKLLDMEDVNEKMNFIRNDLVNNKWKNRFFIKNQSKKIFGKIKNIDKGSV